MFLKEQPQVIDVVCNENKIDFSFIGEKEILVSYLRDMIYKGFPILSFSSVDENLESIFLQIVGGNGV